MSNVQEVATTDERTIQKVARDEVDLPKKPKKRRRPTRRASKVETTQRDLRVVEAVRHAPPSHVQWVDNETAFIWNHPAPWPSQRGDSGDQHDESEGE